MNKDNLTKQMVYLSVFALLINACASLSAPPTPLPPTSTFSPVPPTSTPLPPTSTNTLIPPTATEPPTEISSPTNPPPPHEFIGIWQSSYSYIRFDSDGTLRQARALDELESEPYAISSVHFDGSEMTLTELSVSGVPSCGRAEGVFEIQLLDSGSLLIEVINDQCPPRGEDVATEYEPVR